MKIRPSGSRHAKRTVPNVFFVTNDSLHTKNFSFYQGTFIFFDETYCKNIRVGISRDSANIILVHGNVKTSQPG